MRSRIQSVVPPFDAGEFAEELRAIFRELGRTEADEALAGECSPAIDVYERDDLFEIAVDLPGVEASALRVVVKGNVVLVAGEKSPRRGRGDATFHLVEREFGRFARAIRLAAPCDASRATARLSGGELRVSLPKIAERRGTPIFVSVAAGTPTP